MTKSLSPDGVDAYRRHRQFVRLGQVLMMVGVAIAAVHAVMHLLASPSGWTDLVAGYPMGGVLFLVGAVLAGQNEPKGLK